jgi:ABC-type antimicrobial peptide transport system permease subunit
MNDKLLSSAGGTILSVLGMTSGLLSYQSLAEAFLLGLVGGLAGYLSKKIIDEIIDLFKNHKK